MRANRPAPSVRAQQVRLLLGALLLAASAYLLTVLLLAG